MVYKTLQDLDLFTGVRNSSVVLSKKSFKENLIHIFYSNPAWYVTSFNIPRAFRFKVLGNDLNVIVRDHKDNGVIVIRINIP